MRFLPGPGQAREREEEGWRERRPVLGQRETLCPPSVETVGSAPWPVPAWAKTAR